MNGTSNRQGLVYGMCVGFLRRSFRIDPVRRPVKIITTTTTSVCVTGARGARDRPTTTVSTLVSRRGASRAVEVSRQYRTRDVSPLVKYGFFSIFFQFFFFFVPRFPVTIITSHSTTFFTRSIGYSVFVDRKSDGFGRRLFVFEIRSFLVIENPRKIEIIKMFAYVLLELQ